MNALAIIVFILNCFLFFKRTKQIICGKSVFKGLKSVSVLSATVSQNYVLFNVITNITIQIISNTNYYGAQSKVLVGRHIVSLSF